jgi:hypothetical protein
MYMHMRDFQQEMRQIESTREHQTFRETYSKPTSPASDPSKSLGRAANGSDLDISLACPSFSGGGSPHKSLYRVVVVVVVVGRVPLFKGAKAWADDATSAATIATAAIEKFILSVLSLC